MPKFTSESDQDLDKNYKTINFMNIFKKSMSNYLSMQSIYHDKTNIQEHFGKRLVTSGSIADLDYIDS